MPYYTNQRPVLVGYPFAPIGRGEDIRSTFRALRAVKVNVLICDPSGQTKGSRPEMGEKFSTELTEYLGAGVNIWHLNGNEVEKYMQPFAGRLPPAGYHVIYPQWELAAYPQEWIEQLNRFHEIWAPSRFVFDCLRKAVSKPVFLLPLSVQVDITAFLGRRYFGLPESAYLFLFFFDFRSYIDRKNPQAVIKAFEQVCAARSGGDSRLVLKIHGATGSKKNIFDFKRFMVEVERCKFHRKIIVIDEVFSDTEIKSLLRCCDCFISLHRSEGLGRGLAEAMLLGKPVIATAYSGNLDYMNDGNSCLVPYQLVKIAEGSYPHAQGQVWAEPDIDHAVSHMLKLLDDRDYGRMLGRTASQFIRTHFSSRAIGLRYQRRIDEISNENSDLAPARGISRMPDGSESSLEKAGNEAHPATHR